MYDRGETEGTNLPLHMGSWVEVLGCRVRAHQALGNMGMKIC